MIEPDEIDDAIFGPMPVFRWLFRAKPQVDALGQVLSVDGDTIRLAVLDQGLGLQQVRGSSGLRVRLLGIDTPERKEEGWAEAVAYTAMWLHGSLSSGEEWPLLLRTFKPLPADSFGRYLAVVWNVATGCCLNAGLLESGLARRARY